MNYNNFLARVPIGIFNFELELLKEQNNTCEFIESIKDCNNITIDIPYLEKRIDQLST